MNKISIIIPTYSSPISLDLCLNSCIEGCSDLNNIEVIVGVDGKYDLNKPVLDKYKDKINVLVSEDNLGLPRMLNTLVCNTSYEKILVVCDDNVFQKDFDKILLEEDLDGIVLSINQIEPKPSIFPQFKIEPSIGEDPTKFDVNQLNKYVLSIDPIRNDNSGGTLPFLIQKVDWNRVGGWDIEYPTNGMVADIDFFHKCLLSKMKLMRTYKCHFYHFSSLTVNGIDRQIGEQKAYEYSKHKWGYYVPHPMIVS